MSHVLRKVSAVSIPLLLVGSLVACGSDSPAEPTDPNTVNVGDNFFNPSTLQSSPGTTVTWVWIGGEPHDVTWVTAGLPNSATQTSGTHQVTMPATAGDYDYYCTLHGSPTSGMRGTVRVQ